MLSAVSDSGPLIHLNEIKQKRLFNLFDKIIIPISVFAEVGELNIKNVQIAKVSEKDVASFVKSVKMFKLQKAEIDSLYLAKNTSVMLLTDDLEARNAANHLGIEVHGSLGIIALAYKKEMISLTEAKGLIFGLYSNSTIFLTKSLVDFAIDELEKESK